jgi:hypothetical protein
MGMDVLRSCYKTSMKLWKDREELTPVRWFFCKAGAKVFEPVSSFRSLKTWDRESDRAGMVGEKLGVTPYDKGANPVGYEGLRHCGSDLSVQEGGVSGRDPVIVTTGTGDAACCQTPPTVGVCLPGSVQPFRPRLPVTMLATIVDRGSCSRFAGAQFLMLFLGTGPTDDLSTPGEGPVFAGADCRWHYLSAKTVYSDGPVFQEWMVLGVSLAAQGPGQPEGCPEENCRLPQVYWKVCQLNKLTGITTVEERTVQTYDPVILPTEDPPQFFLTDSLSPPSVFGCQLGGVVPATATWIRFQF